LDKKEVTELRVLSFGQEKGKTLLMLVSGKKKGNQEWKPRNA
jgi:hypothetical protein